MTFVGGDEPQRVIGNFVSANDRDVLGVRVARERTFAPGEDRTGAAVWGSRYLRSELYAVSPVDMTV